MKFLGMVGLLFSLMVVGADVWSSATPTFAHNRSTLQQLEVPLPPRWYNSVTWVNEREFAYLHTSVRASAPTERERLGIYHVESQTEREVAIPNPQTCDRLIYSLLSRLPDTTLGFVADCYRDMTAVGARLVSVNPTTGKQVVLYQYPKQFFPYVYSFAPDMKRSLHSQHGGMSNNGVYLASGRAAPQPLLNQFPHTMEPRWSPSGAQIAFFAIRGNPEQANPDPRLRGIATVTAGWDLLVASPDGQTTQVLLQGVRFPDSLAWFPNESKLVFAGEYRGKAGIWQFALADKKVTRLWHEHARFALSPNAEQLVLIQQSPPTNGQPASTNQLVLLRLP